MSVHFRSGTDNKQDKDLENSKKSANQLFILDPMMAKYGTTNGFIIKDAYLALNKLYALESGIDRAKFILKPENIENSVFIRIIADVLESVDLIGM